MKFKCFAIQVKNQIINLVGTDPGDAATRAVEQGLAKTTEELTLVGDGNWQDVKCWTQLRALLG